MSPEMSMILGLLGSVLVLGAHVHTALKLSVIPGKLVHALSAAGGALLTAHLVERGGAWGPAALNCIWTLTSGWAAVRDLLTTPEIWSMRPQKSRRLERARALLRAAGVQVGMSESQVAALAQEILTPLGEKLLIVRADRSTLVFANVMRHGEIPVHEHLCSDQLELVVSGTVKVTVGAEQANLGPGQFVLIPRNTPHTLAPVEVDGAIVASVVLGKFHPLAFFRKWHGTPTPGGMDARQHDQLKRDLWTLARTRLVNQAGATVRQRGDRP